MRNKEKLTKIAYQIGTQGYALMNDRAFCNCQKKKMDKTNSPHKAWNDCWKEYKEAYNGDPDKWLAKYIPIDPDKSPITASSIKKTIKDNFIKDVEDLKGDSPYVGASIRNVLRSYAVKELKDIIEKESK